MGFTFPDLTKDLGVKSESVFLKIPDNGASLVFFLDTPEKWAYFKKCFGKDTVYKTTDEVDGAKFRFRSNVAWFETMNSAPEVKIFESGTQVYKELQNLHQDWPVDETVFKVQKTGTGMQTTYRVVPVRKLAPDYIAKLQQMEKKDIDPNKDKSFEGAGAMPEPPPGFSDNAPPFDEVPF